MDNKQPKKLLEQVADLMRIKHYSLRTKDRITVLPESLKL